MLPPELHTRALRYARRHGISLAALVRQVLTEEVARSRGADKKYSIFTKHVWRGRAPRDLAKNHDKYLYDLEP